MAKNNFEVFANDAVLRYNQPGFIVDDPISIPHEYTKKEDIEIAAFFAATIAWGQRKTILANARKLMTFMDHKPHDFILNHAPSDLKPFVSFVHRTFQADDALYFVFALREIYTHQGGLESLFTQSYINTLNMNDALGVVRDSFFAYEHLNRTHKHFSDPRKGSAAKRLHMFLRWMVRRDNAGVDFGIWRDIPMYALMPPLDVHSARVARKWNLLDRKQDDRKAVEELQMALLKWDPIDPIKYDFALYGAGVNAEF